MELKQYWLTTPKELVAGWMGFEQSNGTPKVRTTNGSLP
jgi:hypothetical protein